MDITYKELIDQLVETESFFDKYVAKSFVDAVNESSEEFVDYLKIDQNGLDRIETELSETDNREDGHAYWLEATRFDDAVVFDVLVMDGNVVEVIANELQGNTELSTEIARYLKGER